MPLIVSGVKLYDVKEVADMLKSTEATIRVYFREGKLKGRKINGKWRVSVENLNRFINGDPIDTYREEQK
jgi:predicted site-specific integrase-resolvase